MKPLFTIHEGEFLVGDRSCRWLEDWTLLDRLTRNAR